MVKLRIFGGVAMPVIPVELQNYILAGKVGINAKASINHELADVINTHVVEHPISKLFTGGCFSALKGIIHFQELHPAGRVSVPARNRTVPNVVRLSPRWGPFKFLLASLTGVSCFISTLKRVCTLFGAELHYFVLLLARGAVNARATLTTSYLGSRPPCQPSPLYRAFARAIFSCFGEAPREILIAYRAVKFAHCVHVILAQFQTSTIKPKQVMKYA